MTDPLRMKKAIVEVLETTDLEGSVLFALFENQPKGKLEKEINLIRQFSEGLIFSFIIPLIKPTTHL